MKDRRGQTNTLLLYFLVSGGGLKDFFGVFEWVNKSYLQWKSQQATTMDTSVKEQSEKENIPAVQLALVRSVFLCLR